MTRPISDLDVPVTRLQADVQALVARQTAQRLADLDALRERLPLNDPDRHALDVDADRLFAQMACDHPEKCTCDPKDAQQ